MGRIITYLLRYLAKLEVLEVQPLDWEPRTWLKALERPVKRSETLQKIKILPQDVTAESLSEEDKDMQRRLQELIDERRKKRKTVKHYSTATLERLSTTGELKLKMAESAEDNASEYQYDGWH